MDPIIRPVQARSGWRFWLLTLATVAALGLTASLGAWQLSRAAQKQALQALLAAREAMPALVAGELAQARPADVAGLLHRSVQLQGQWLPEATVYLDNRQMQGRPGFWVLTPLRLSTSQAVVLVQRGWVPRDFQERTRLPDIATPAGEVRIHGRIAAGVGRLYEFAPAGKGEGASRIRQNLDLVAYGAETGLPLLPLVVLQTGAASDGLLRDWAPIDSGVDKHYGYAFQWFGLCGLVFVLYVWFQLVRRFPSLGRRPSR
ncbi:MAG: SURF1 family protein [Proteobacteria bacterium]|nr:SURF1 family protein [Pseudomonadota bacterium]